MILGARIYESYGGATFVAVCDGSYDTNVYVRDRRCACPTGKQGRACLHLIFALAHYERYRMENLAQSMVDDGDVRRGDAPGTMIVTHNNRDFFVKRHTSEALIPSRPPYYICSCSPKEDQDVKLNAVYCTHVQAARLFAKQEADRAQSPATAPEAPETTSESPEEVITQPDPP